MVAVMESSVRDDVLVAVPSDRGKGGVVAVMEGGVRYDVMVRTK